MLVLLMGYVVTLSGCYPPLDFPWSFALAVMVFTFACLFAVRLLIMGRLLSRALALLLLCLYACFIMPYWRYVAMFWG